MERWQTCVSDNSQFDDKVKDPWYSRICWWEPRQNSIPAQFCQNTTVHGLKFITKPKQHISERIFWIVAFLFGLVSATVLINDVWKRYRANPVIVIFQPKDLQTDRIPFPAVTICNFNKFPKSKVTELKRIAADTSNKKESQLAIKRLGYVRSVCEETKSFSREYDFADRELNDDSIGHESLIEDEKQEMLKFIFQEAIPCEDLIRICIFAERKRNCSELFKPIISDYGKCCTFNMLPLPLLIKDKDNNTVNTFLNITTANGTIWRDLDINRWQQWDYKDGMVMDENLYWPFRQKRAGMPFGLTILIDANVDEYYCSSSDAEGFRFLAHSPLEMPHVRDFANIIGLGKEVYVQVNQHVTNADDEVRGFKRDSRNCYFGDDQQLDYYQAYTGRNCIDDCILSVYVRHCNCSVFYMPRAPGIKVCSMDKGSADAKCVKRVKANLTETLKVNCSYCDNLCEDVSYHFHITEVRLRNPQDLWHDSDPDFSREKIPESDIPAWTRHKMTIVHVFLESDTTVPILRKRLYADTDLVASTGGIMGLCLGVSVLSAVEAIYFFTFRACFKFCRRKKIREKLCQRLNRIRSGVPEDFNTNKSTIMDPDMVFVYSSKLPIKKGDIQLQKYPSVNSRGFSQTYDCVH